MKRILLATASIVAFAGAAAADHVSEDTPDGVSLGGSGTLGYNDEQEGGFYTEGSLGLVLARELDNGLLAAITFGLDFNDSNEGDGFGGLDLSADAITLSLTDRSGSNGLHFGSTRYAAERHWNGGTDASGISIPDAYDGLMAADAFSEQSDETVIRGDTTFGTFNTSVSYNVADADGDSADDLDQLSVGASGVIGGFTMNIAYQQESDAIDQICIADNPATPADESNDDTSADGVYDSDCDDDFSTDEVFGVSAGTTFGGADVRLAYATNRTDETSSLGISAQYPFGPVSLSGFYTLESAEDDAATPLVDESDVEDSYGISAGYEADTFGVSVFYESEQGDDDSGINARYSGYPGLDVFAGYSRDEEGYVAAQYDLGGGASILASFAETEDAGPNDYKEGTTIALSLSF